MSTAANRPVNLIDLVADWQRLDPTAPRLTWYGPDGERVELSGRVLANWAIKAANLLAEEADAGPGSVVGITLPVHWRAVVWSLGAWLTGAQLWLGTPDGAPDGLDVLVTDRPDAGSSAGVLVAVPLPALAMVFDGDLPPGAVDGAADLMTQPDVLVQPSAPVPGSAAIGDITHAELAAWALHGRDPAASARALVTETTTAEAVRAALALWLRGGSVVLVGRAADDAALAHIAQVEGASS